MEARNDDFAVPAVVEVIDDPAFPWINEVPFPGRGTMRKNSKPKSLTKAEKRQIQRDIGIAMAIAERYRYQRFHGPIFPCENVIANTGIQPEGTHGLYCIDFDVDEPLANWQMWELHRILVQMGIVVKEMAATGSGGLHVLVLSDTTVEIHNGQGYELQEGIFPEYVKDVDIRGKGGKIFRPPTKFADHPFSYQVIYTTPSCFLMDSATLDGVIDSFYTNRKGGSSLPGDNDDDNNKPGRRRSGKKVSVEIPDEIPLDVMQKVNEMREPLRMLVSEGAPDIHDLPARQQGGEFLVWKALFLESRSKEIPDEYMFALLKKHQPKFDVHHTVYQLQYLGGLKPFKNETLERLIIGP